MAWNYRTPLERKAISNGTRPPILRRLLIPADLTLCSLHCVLQPAMGWEDCHMHGFVSVDKDSVTPIRVRHSWRPGSSKRNARPGSLPFWARSKPRRSTPTILAIVGNMGLRLKRCWHPPRSHLSGMCSRPNVMGHLKTTVAGPVSTISWKRSSTRTTTNTRN